MTNYNKDTDKLKSLDRRKILINNTEIIYKNNYKNVYKSSKHNKRWKNHYK